MWPFKKKTSLTKLYSLVKKKEKKDWNKQLNQLVKIAETSAKNGNTFLTISDKIIRCSYNMTRQRDLILKDVQQKFKKCDVFFSSIHGQTTIEIRWKK